MRVEGGEAVGDVAVNEAYDNVGRCYDFYFDVFGRDSWDGKGAGINTSVHFDVWYNNAYWNGEQVFLFSIVISDETLTLFYIFCFDIS